MGGWNGRGGARFRPHISTGEGMVDLAQNRMQMWVTTRDGTFNDRLLFTATFRDGNSGPGGKFTTIDTLGGYFGATAPGPGVWYELDDIVVDTQKIGPPAGFVVQ
ncbi:MAG: hypothetical protein JNK82_35295 [Myxococcaceae bacterium]|nr:hypothetical protein [Myxococcaceae bacterium]